MHVGIHNVRFDFPGAQTRSARRWQPRPGWREDVGVAGFTLMDHWFQMEQMAPATDPMLEGYTRSASWPGGPRRCSLGLLVTGVTYRHPGLLAKIVATLDVLSGGRAQLGIGAAWYEREHKGLGVPYPPVAERFERLEETCRSAGRCGATTTGPSRDATTSWRRRSVRPARSASPARRS